MGELTQKQKLFVEAYLATSNATESAKKAGYSEKTAYSQGQQLLKKLEIQEALKARTETAIITANEVLNGVKAIAYNGEKDSDKLKAFELLGKYLALWTDKQQQEGTLKIVVEYE